MRLRHLSVAALMVASFLAGTLVPAARTDNPGCEPAKYIDISYMKVEPGMEAEYVSLETDVWKPLHAERIRAGRMNWWAIYALRFPIGTEEPYNFVAVQGYDQMNNLAHTYDEELALLPKIHLKLKVEDFVRQTESARKLVRGEVWTLVDHAE